MIDKMIDKDLYGMPVPVSDRCDGLKEIDGLDGSD